MLSLPTAARFPPLELRAIRFDDVPEVLRLIRRSVDHGCREHYDQRQRNAVYASYASSLFVEALGNMETVAAESAGRVVGFAQLDSAEERLRALFVDADFQRRGVGGVLLADIEARARARGCRGLGGAMSLNAVPFYAAAGFSRCPGPERLMAAGVWIRVVRMSKTIAVSG